MFNCTSKIIEDFSIDTSVRLSDVLEKYSVDHILYTMQKINHNVGTDIADFIKISYEGGLEAFYEEFKS